MEAFNKCCNLIHTKKIITCGLKCKHLNTHSRYTGYGTQIFDSLKNNNDRG